MSAAVKAAGRVGESRFPPAFVRRRLLFVSVFLHPDVREARALPCLVSLGL